MRSLAKSNVTAMPLTEKMLKELVPWGRTHRLAVLVAGMLRYAWSCKNNSRSMKDKNHVAQLMEESGEVGMDFDEQRRIMLPVIEQLFRTLGSNGKDRAGGGTPEMVSRVLSSPASAP